MNLTSAQQQAIAARGNVVVVAGAGTGKTRTLVERCLDCLLNEGPRPSLDEILMVTFTEAAAAEMRQRIRSRLEQEMAQRPHEAHWQEQLALFETAHIGTVHSFCLQLVRQHFYELELDPQLTVLTEEEARLLAEETLDGMLQRHYAGRGRAAEAVLQLIQTQGRGWDRPIRVLTLKIHHYSQTLPDPAGWIRGQVALFATDEPTAWGPWLLQALADWRAQWLPALDREAATNDLAAECASAVRGLPLRPNRGEAATALEAVVAAARDWPRGTRMESIKPLQAFLDEAGFLLPLAAANGKTDPLKEDWSWVREQMGTLLELAREFTRTFTEAKRELGVVDFHDLEQHALRLLWDVEGNRPTKTAQQWRGRLRFIFVDEYQDINAAQDKIVQALSRDAVQANRFLVGDVKQSIYRFRLANPKIFQRYVDQWSGTKGTAVTLADNFRSRRGILDFVNSVFTDLMRRELGGVSYNKQAQLKFGTAEQREALSADTNDAPRVELHLRLKSNGEADTGDGDASDELAAVKELEEAAKEARLVALRLRELKAEQHRVWDEASGQFRPVEWQDMAILLRAPSGKAESYAKEFARLEVPLQVARAGFYRNLEISDLLSLLQLLDNPLQDLPALAVLHSPLVGLTLDELADVRRTALKTRFWTALVRWYEINQVQSPKSKVQSPEPEVPGPTSQVSSPKSTVHGPQSTVHGPQSAVGKVGKFLERFGRWRRLARQASLSRCLEAVLTETHYADWLSTQPRSEQREANIRRLLGLAEQFDQFQRQGLFRFLRFIEAQQLAETEPEVPATAEVNAVRLMSIHQSKGLEFPVIVVADLAKPFNLADLRGEIILDEEYGLCPQIKPPQTGKRYPSLPYWLASRRQKRELLGEELRLLYVAMTRARDTLLLSAAVTESRFETVWQTPGEVTTETLLAGHSYADWLGLWFSRQEGGRPQHTGENPMFRCIMHDETKLIIPEGNEATRDDFGELESMAEPEVLEKLERRLTWQYNFDTATRQPAKTSVSVLRRRATAADDEELSEVMGTGPGFPKSKVQSPESEVSTKAGRQATKASAVEIGNAHHRFLEHVAIEKTETVAQLEAEAQRLSSAGWLSAGEVELLDFGRLAAFWSSELGGRIRAQARFVERELPFTARFSPAELAQITGEPADPRLASEFVVVQGIVDLEVVLPKEIWVLDFKTDEGAAADLAAAVERYKPQVRLYAEALTRIYQRPVTERWLYFLMAREARAISEKS